MNVISYKDLKDPLTNAFSAALEHEKEITENIRVLSQVSKDENDKLTYAFLKWFRDEQVKEEANVNKALRKILQGSVNLKLVDDELGKRG